MAERLTPRTDRQIVYEAFCRLLPMYGKDEHIRIKPVSDRAGGELRIDMERFNENMRWIEWQRSLLNQETESSYP